MIMIKEVKNGFIVYDKRQNAATDIHIGYTGNEISEIIKCLLNAPKQPLQEAIECETKKLGETHTGLLKRISS